MANGFNPLQSVAQGLNLKQGIQDQQRQNQLNQLRSAIGQQASQGGFNPNQSLELQQLAALDPTGAAQTLASFQAIGEGRQKEFFQDARKARRMLESGDSEGFLNLVQTRLNKINAVGGDPSDTMNILSRYAQGDIQGVMQSLSNVEMMGIESGFLKAPKSIADESVQSSKILDDGSVIQVLKSGKRQVISNKGEILTGIAARDAVAKSRDQAFERKKELKRLDQRIKSAQKKEDVLTENQKLTQKGNISRIGMLSGTATGRDSAIKKAVKFRDMLRDGKAFSGAGRRGAQFIPGVYTSQGEFDEEFNAFAEVAARQQLKAAGETRPTDADVQGMKNAMFGIGRDEEVNVRLLNDFIEDQLAQNEELDALIKASKSGDLSTFIFNSSPKKDVKDLSDDELFN